MGKLDESRAILKSFGLPPEQQNEVAAYTLLALAGLKERQSWSRGTEGLLLCPPTAPNASRNMGMTPPLTVNPLWM